MSFGVKRLVYKHKLHLWVGFLAWRGQNMKIKTQKTNSKLLKQLKVVFGKPKSYLL